MQEPHWIHLDHEGREVVTTVSPEQRNRTDGVDPEVTIVNLHPQVTNASAGMTETCFRVSAIEPYLGATRLLVQLTCDHSLTPWCEQTDRINR